MKSFKQRMQSRPASAGQFILPFELAAISTEPTDSEQEEPSLFQHCLADLGAPISHEHAHLTLLLGQQCVKTDYERTRADKAEQAAAALQAELDTALTQLEQERAVVVQEKAALLAEVQQERSRRKGLEQDLQQNGLLGQHLERDFDAELAHTQEQYAQVRTCEQLWQEYMDARNGDMASGAATLQVFYKTVLKL